ncbi:hypothetical protein SynBIOSE41_00741 [Synechococcus sp. BIOS-E4-1]|uniref:DUF4178 domain-containing protein n=1 Tax=Synechococcus sp. BIOS-E4-1 TaxID=1400864 RepID=UPI0016453427|nr:DUF4178 domain-containing protein [Synechococcus sp. BIOS-E4-1]QNI53278.1 hypothetical protein SynBIOSE41_00741 [Synechococcus sp. BIOS-E4-1]
MLFILILVLIAALAVWLRFRSKRMAIGRYAELKGKVATERTLFTLQIGDVVQYQARDWIVETVYRYQQGQFEWTEYLLRDNSDVAWLVVVEDDWLEVSWLSPVPEDQLHIELPPPRYITYAGTDYSLKEKGEARYSTEGRAKNQLGNCLFYDYEAKDGLQLSLEAYDSKNEGGLDINVGEKIDSRDLSLLPGDGRSVYSKISR